MAATTSIVIFGASGDLTRRKLIPALYNLLRKGRLPENTQIVGLARRDYDDDVFRDNMRQAIQEFIPDKFDQKIWDEFAPMLHYIAGDLTRLEAFHKLDAALKENEAPDANRLYYLSVSPKFYDSTASNLDTAKMNRASGCWRRIIVEKPFGRDLESALELNRSLQSVFDEEQIYRIDHYLGKETSQNIMFFRFANTMFEPIWNRNYVDHVQITVAESVDVGHRADFYDGTGILRDMFQNHLLQLLTLVAMEAPASFEANAVRDEKYKVLRSIRPMAADYIAENTVLAQYDGYMQTEGVKADSRTATYAAVKLAIDNWRWQGVPFYLRSGKALKEKVSDIVITFKRPPHMMFPLPPGTRIKRNYLAIGIQPDEGIHTRFEAKVPDTVADMKSVDMEFHYTEGFKGRALPEAYERLLLDALQGDASLFTRSDGIERSWELMDSIIKVWDDPKGPALASYDPGSWGPTEADYLMGRDSQKWIVGCGDHMKKP